MSQAELPRKNIRDFPSEFSDQTARQVKMIGRVSVLPEFPVRIGTSGVVYVARTQHENSSSFKGGIKRIIKVGRSSETGAHEANRQNADFQQEAANVTPYVPRVRDVSSAELSVGRRVVQDGNLYPIIVMDYFPGLPISDMIKLGGVGVDDAIRALHKVGSALDRIGKQDIVHNNITPHNIISTSLDLDVGLYDFDAAVRAGAERPGTKIVFSTDYCAPEQLTLEPLTPAADVFGLVSTTFATAFGATIRDPFIFDELTYLRGLQGSDVYPRIVSHRLREMQLPTSIQDVFMHGLAHDPHDRYPTAAEFFKDLAKADATSSNSVYPSAK